MVGNHATEAATKRPRWINGFLYTVALLALAGTAQARSPDADPARELTNPVADLITLPIQMNYDQDIGPADKGEKLTTNVQPVIPFDVGYWADSPPGGPEGLRLRFQVNIVLPK